MSLVKVNGAGVVRGVLTLPRAGAWHADLDLDLGKPIEGRATIEIADAALALVGTVSAGYTFDGAACVRIVGGADGLRKRARPQHYTRPQLRVPLGDLLRQAGETLSPTVASSVLGRHLPHWTILGNSIGEQLGALVERAAPDGSVWRLLPDGTVWIGKDTYPASAVTTWRELDRMPADDHLVLGLDAPVLLPGTKLGDEVLVDYVEHVIDDGGRIRTHVWGARAA